MVEIELIHGDCLEHMKTMPDKSVDLILTDPPFFRVKNEPWDKQWDNADKFLEWINELCQQWKRILKPNGSLYVFASPKMAARVEVTIDKNFNVLNQIRWIKEAGWHKKTEKEALRSFLSPWESIIFAEQTFDQYSTQAKALHKEVYAPLGRYIQLERERAGFTRNEVEVALGYTSSQDPTRGTALCYRWEEGSALPTKEAYNKLRVFLNTKAPGEYLQREYEELRRPFTVTPKIPFTDTLNFAPVLPSNLKHVCEKPLTLLRHILEVSSKPGQTVLDCFLGSGATGHACIDMDRSFIGIEKSLQWYSKAKRRLKGVKAQGRLF